MGSLGIVSVKNLVDHMNNDTPRRDLNNACTKQEQPCLFAAILRRICVLGYFCCCWGGCAVGVLQSVDGLTPAQLFFFLRHCGQDEWTEQDLTACTRRTYLEWASRFIVVIIPTDKIQILTKRNSSCQAGREQNMSSRVRLSVIKQGVVHVRNVGRRIQKSDHQGREARAAPRNAWLCSLPAYSAASSSSSNLILSAHVSAN